MATEKPGRSAASAFAPGCGGDITKRREELWARQALYSALNLLEARAQFDGPERKVHVRVAEHDGRLYLDLADDALACGRNWARRMAGIGARRCVSAGRPACCRCRCRNAAGRSKNSRRSSTFQPKTISCWSVAWLLATLRAGGPYPLLAISGEQGSAKTVSSKMLRALVDPNAAPVRALPREERELMIAANNGHVLAFDNLSGLPPWLSDTLCRLASGGSFAVRQLYTDQDEVLFQRPARCFSMASRTSSAGPIWPTAAFF